MPDSQPSTASAAAPATVIDCHRFDLGWSCPPEALQWLSSHEQARAARFRFAHLQERYRASRIALRATLAARLGIHPAEVRFVRSARGKPSLDPVHDSTLHFNLTHSEHVAWLVIGEVENGVDLEILGRKVRFLDGLVGRVTSPTETRILTEIPDEDLREKAFLLSWTRKESPLKAWGLGIAGMASLNTLDTRLPEADQLQAFFTTDSQLPLARIEFPEDAPQPGSPNPDRPAQGGKAGAFAPLYLSSHYLGADLVTISAPVPFSPRFHLDPEPPFSAAPPQSPDTAKPAGGNRS